MARWDDLAIELKCEILRQAVLSAVENCCEALKPNPSLTTIESWKPAKQFASFRSMLLTCREFYQLLKFEVKLIGLNTIQFVQATQFVCRSPVLKLLSDRDPLYQPKVYPQNLPQRIRDPDTVVLDKQTFVVDDCSTEPADAVKETKPPFFELVQEFLGRFWRNPFFENDFSFAWSILLLEFMKERHCHSFLVHLEPWLLHFSQESDRCCPVYWMHCPERVVHGEAHAPVYDSMDYQAIILTLSSRYICLNRAHGTMGTWTIQTVSNIIFPENYVGDTLPGVIGDATEDWWFVQLDPRPWVRKEWCFINFREKLVLNSFDCVLRSFDDRECEAELEQRLL